MDKKFTKEELYTYLLNKYSYLNDNGAKAAEVYELITKQKPVIPAPSNG